jgi:tight adherence protein C
VTTWIAVCGGVGGAGLFLLVRVLVPVRVDPAVGGGRGPMPGVTGGWRGPISNWLLARGYQPRGATADLAVTGQTVESFIATKAVLVVVGLVFPLLFDVLWSMVGLSLPLEIPAMVSLGCAAGSFFLPDLQLRKNATAARVQLRRTLGSYLDLVSMGLAGGRGLAEALSVAAQIGEGWTFRLLADTADRARPLGISPWTALGQLGERLRVPELVDLGATLNLAGSEGAQIRSSLAARAATLRGRMLADATGAAATDDQSMGIAQVILGLGFLLFITYPAVYQVLATN